MVDSQRITCSEAQFDDDRLRGWPAGFGVHGQEPELRGFLRLRGKLLGVTRAGDDVLVGARLHSVRCRVHGENDASHG